ncbi:MAG: 3-phosphoshikimate 1-carboxyvinyltransferase [Eubacteriales bacterium]|nr:3-phosphoshikimate 1-carboxyvinyltransferase [Eubacteriales bacterium]
MADRHVRPSALHGSLVPPPSKSDAHRALICAALAGEESRIKGIGSHPSDDILATRRCLQALGDAITARRSGKAPTKTQLTLDCHESGTTLRLLIPVVAALGVPATFTGRGRLPQRPLQEYRTIFAGHGIDLDFPAEGSLPLSVRGQLTPGLFHVPGHVSSQYLSGLLLALPLLDGDSEIVLTSPLESAPYVEMTRRTLGEFGVVVHTTPSGYQVAGRQRFLPVDYTVEKDYSQAAFWLVANYLGSEIKLSGLSDHSAQGDRAILPILASLAKHQASELPFIIDAAQIPDLVPVLAVAASLTPGQTRITNAARLRLKESDRLAVTADILASIGAQIRVEDDSLVIDGQTELTGGQADSHGDHRIAMALAIAALKSAKGVIITQAEAVRKSYPEFFAEFSRLGGICDELNLG